MKNLETILNNLAEKISNDRKDLLPFYGLHNVIMKTPEQMDELQGKHLRFILWYGVILSPIYIISYLGLKYLANKIVEYFTNF